MSHLDGTRGTPTWLSDLPRTCVRDECGNTYTFISAKLFIYLNSLQQNLQMISWGDRTLHVGFTSVSVPLIARLRWMGAALHTNG